MAQKREMLFDSIYGGLDGVDKDEMLDGNRDKITKDQEPVPEKKLKAGKELKANNNLEINGTDYDITF